MGGPRNIGVELIGAASCTPPTSFLTSNGKQTDKHQPRHCPRRSGRPRIGDPLNRRNIPTTASARIHATHEDRHLEHQRRQGPHRGAAGWLKAAVPTSSACRRSRASDRGLPGERDRGARIQRRRARPEGLQWRGAAVEDAARGCSARPAGRARRGPVALHRGRGAAGRRRRSGRRRSICRTAIRSAPRSSTTSSPGWPASRPTRARCWRSRSRWCWPATTTSFPSRCDAKHPSRLDRGRAVPAAVARRLRRRLQASASPMPSAPATRRPGVYTFWDYQAGAWQKDNGIRIDHLLLSPQAADRLGGAGIDKSRARLGEAVGPRAGMGGARYRLR